MNLKQAPDYQELRQLLGFSPPIDEFMSASFARPVVDFPMLDMILKNYWKAEYTEGISQDEFILKKFGARAAELLNKML